MNEQHIGKFLRYGVLVCAAIIGVGMALVILVPESVQPPLNDLLSQLRAGGIVAKRDVHPSVLNPDGIITYGLMLLISLPVLRVALTVVLFAKQREPIFVAISTLVLGTLLFGLLVG